MPFTGFVAANHWFRNHWKFRSVMTRVNNQYSAAGLRMYGRADIAAGKLQPKF